MPEKKYAEGGFVGEGARLFNPVIPHDGFIPLKDGKSIPIESRVMINVQDWDSREVVALLEKHKDKILEIVQSAYERRGKPDQGPKG